MVGIESRGKRGRVDTVGSINVKSRQVQRPIAYRCLLMTMEVLLRCHVDTSAVGIEGRYCEHTVRSASIVAEHGDRGECPCMHLQVEANLLSRSTSVNGEQEQCREPRKRKGKRMAE
jgi:hypothetical protein